MNRLVPALLVVSWIAGLCIVGCGGSPAVTCQTTSCPSGAQTYQVCSHTDGSVSYDFGGMSCSCAGGSSAACQAGASEVAAYCNEHGGAGRPAAAATAATAARATGPARPARPTSAAATSSTRRRTARGRARSSIRTP